MPKSSVISLPEKLSLIRLCEKGERKPIPIPITARQTRISVKFCKTAGSKPPIEIKMIPRFTMCFVETFRESSPPTKKNGILTSDGKVMSD